MKKIKVLMLAVIVVLFSGILTSCEKEITLQNPVSSDDVKQQSPADPISRAIFENHNYTYMFGECAGEGHIIIDEEETPDGGKIVYAFTMYGQYGFENGAFIKVSGSGKIPVRITFDKDGNVTEYKEPLDGGMWKESIEEIFPEKYHGRIFADNGKEYDELRLQEHAYAQAYLDKIGRVARIGQYADIEHKIPEMHVEASNKLLEYFGEYPYWIGTLEKIEDGVRYVYEKKTEEKSGGDALVTFLKYEYDSGKVVEETVISVENGELVYLKGTPRYKSKIKG